MSNYSSQWIKVSEPFPHVLLVQLAREPVNAFRVEFWEAYGLLFDSLTEDGYDVRCAVLCSAFPRYFTTGLDLNDNNNLGSASTDVARTALSKRNYLLAFQRALGAPERASFPVIAALHGHVIGVGVDMLGPIDIRYTAEDAKFSIKEVDIGFAPGLGTLAFLPKIASSHSLIRELAYTARTFDAFEAEKIGLVSKVVPGGRDNVVREALELARTIAAKSPLAVSGAKHLITHSRDTNVPRNLVYTTTWNGGALRTKDLEESLEAVTKKALPSFVSLAVQTKLPKL